MMRIAAIKRHNYPLLLYFLFILTYVPTLIWMWDRWFARDSYYSHGILIPLVSGYLVWQNRQQLPQPEFRPVGGAIFLIVGGLIIHLVSSLFRVYFSSGFSMLFVLSGLILLFYGGSVWRLLWFPICFLFFMIPVPLIAVINISFKMKLFAASIATFLLNQMGLEAIREGSILRLRHATVIVDDVCSGLRSLISLMALGSIFAYWLRAPVVKKIILFLATIPIAIITNVCRVVVLSSIGEIWGAKYATGFIHDATGFLVFALAFVMLYCVGRILE